MTDNNPIPFYAKATIIAVGIVASFYILYQGESIFVPLIFALFIAILVNPLANFLIRKKINRVVSIFMVLLLVMVVVGGLTFFLLYQFTMFKDAYPLIKEKLITAENDIVGWFANKLNTDAAALQAQISTAINNASKSVMNNVGQTILGVGSFLVLVVLIPVYIFLILFYKHLLLEFIRKLFDPKSHTTVVEILGNINTIIRSYLLGLLIEGAIVATLNSVALLALGIRYAILMGVTGAILNVIPYIGGIAAIALPVIIALATKSVLSAVLVFAAYTVIQFIDNHYLIPYIVASKVKLNALVAIAVVLVGDIIWGVPGMFLSIPLTALIKVVCDHIEQLKPYGFLLGDNVPDTIRLPFKKKS